ncbi:hypothetical protein ROLI_011230 [Roseobacter fucihabitans]|uniref:Transposase InsH N-terminal domain-containing protein n=1 Tax=Roseobacter fucihabitans TaxID=1537242 RepID=A0ABZ2BRF3_9RHOB|nr:hypothetical protein [Roseobacter litoralis]
MMGPKQEAQAALFYEFSLEDHIPQDHLLRSIDRFVDLNSVCAHLADFYSHTGRPSIDAELLVRGLLLWYSVRTTAVRRGVSEPGIQMVLSPGFGGPHPRSFYRFKEPPLSADCFAIACRAMHGRFRESELLRHVFETTVVRCMKEGWVGGQGFAMDASLISVDVQKQNSSNPDDWAAQDADSQDAPRAVREYLSTLDDEAFGRASEVTPKFIAHADPASQWTAARKGPAFFAYSDNYLIDTDHAIIVDVDAIRAILQAEVGAIRKVIDRTKDRFGITPDWVAADTAYGSSDNLVWLTLKRQSLPFIPVFHCPAGHCAVMSREGTIQNARTAHGHGLISHGTKTMTATSVLRVKNSATLYGTIPILRGARPNWTSPIPQPQTRVSGLPFKSQVLPQYPHMQHQPREIRNRQRLRPAMHFIRVQHGSPETSKEGRDVVCTSQTHLRPGQVPITRTMWCPRRIYTRRQRPKSPQIGKAQAVGARHRITGWASIGHPL